MKQDSVRDNLTHACFVVDALGSKHKEEFIKQFCDRQLEVYSKEFAPGSQFYKLQSLENRYDWYKQLFKHYKENYAVIYPPQWYVAEHLTLAFCLKTKEALNTILQDELKKKDDLSKSIKGSPVSPPSSEGLYELYWKSMTITVNFENEVSLMFPQADNITKTDKELENTPKPETNVPASTAKPRSTIFKGKISDLFNDYMFIFIEYYDKEMKNFFEAAFSAETWTLDNDNLAGKKKAQSLTKFTRFSLSVICLA